MSRDRGAEAFDRLFRDHAAPLLRFVVYHTGDPVLAEDIVADTFERALRSRKRFRGDAAEKTWLYTIALNRLRDLGRRRAAESRALERAAVRAGDEEADAGWREDRLALRDAVAQLSDEQRVVVSLRFGAGLKFQEIAELLGEPRSTVEGRVYAALERLRGMLG